jgi:MoxR-like ATPase
MPWKYFDGNCGDQPRPLEHLPECPPWRQFLPLDAVDAAADAKYWAVLHDLAAHEPRAIQRGQSFRLLLKDGTSEVIDAVNAAIHLRRPLLVTGAPGSGKTTLAYAIAYELQLGPVLKWPITARATLQEAQYRYDAIARLQDVQLDAQRGQTPTGPAALLPPPKEEQDLGDYIQLGPVGTAFLPSLRPRVLLIDEIDKSDLNLPNDLLNLFEEGEFEITELARRKRRGQDAEDPNVTVEVRTADENMTAPITNGQVQCGAFPIVIMTSNGEREFPPAFYRRCLRVEMPAPTVPSLQPIVQAHFQQNDPTGWTGAEENLIPVIEDFLRKDGEGARATDQLLNAIYLMTRPDRPSEEEMKRLQKLLFKRLNEDA